MQRIAVTVLSILFLAAPAPVGAKISEKSQECLDCHEDATPGIVADWRSSLHAQTVVGEAMQKEGAQRRVSSEEVPESLKPYAVGCYECHGLRPEKHKDNFDHFDFKINVVVSPDDCAVCHAKDAAEYAVSKKAHAVDILDKNPIYHLLQETITGPKTIEEGQIVSHPTSPTTRGETCFACHGTRVEVQGMRTIETDLGEIEVPRLTQWPNQGVGRINPDGSQGACTACHPRHGFSLEVARKPHTCAQCHLEPDVPGWEVWKESKHGNIALSMGEEWNWTAVPWKVGEDFTTPTCAACHMAGLAKPDGEMIAQRTHDFGARLWTRIFGLIYSHPQPKSAKTWEIRNADGLPLPTGFDGSLASDYLIDEAEMDRRQSVMKSVCRGCHSTSWTEGHFDKFEATVKEADGMVASATTLMAEAWEKGLADKTNPFDEALEHLWVKQWLFQANTTRYAAAMSGQDYASFKYGWWEMSATLQKMRKQIDLLEATKEKK